MSRPSKKKVNAEDLVMNDNAEDLLGIKTDMSDKEEAVLAFYDNGMVRSFNQASVYMLKYSRKELIGQHITQLFPQLKKIELIQNKKVNSYLHCLSRIGYRFEVVTMNGSCFMSKLFFIDMEYLGRHYLRVVIRAV